MMMSGVPPSKRRAAHFHILYLKCVTDSYLDGAQWDAVVILVILGLGLRYFLHFSHGYYSANYCILS